VTFTKYFLENNSSANSSCPSPVKWCVNDSDGYKLCIESPTLVPTCLLALLISIFCSKRISKLSGKFPTRWFYHLAFFLYGIMMTSACIYHCFFDNEPTSSNILANTNADSIRLLHLLVLITDVSVSTNIAITILFCGLCDIKFLNPQSIMTRCLLIILHLFVFLLWTLGILNNWSWIANVLYYGVIAISNFTYLLTQLCIKSNRRALSALFAAGIYGAIGLFAKSFGAEHICKSEGPFWSQYIGPEFLWYLFSDISMAFIFIYVIRVNQEKKIDYEEIYY